jgi:hypothetical protein
MPEIRIDSIKRPIITLILSKIVIEDKNTTIRVSKMKLLTENKTGIEKS